MSLLLSLPKEILVIILQEWLRLPRILSRLDMAILGSHRYELLDILACTSFCVNECGLYCTTVSDIALFAKWLAARDIKLPKLLLYTSKIADVCNAIQGKTIRGLDRIAFVEDPTPLVDTNPEALRTLLLRLPSLTSADFHEWTTVTDQHLLAIKGIKLCGININSCFYLSRHCLEDMLQHQPGCVQSLHMANVHLSDAALQLISTNTALQELTLNCSSGSSQFIQALFVHCKRLRQLSLQDSTGLTLTDSMIRGIAAQCHDLEDFSCSSHGLTMASLPALFEGCPKLCSLAFTGMGYSVLRSSSGVFLTSSTTEQLHTQLLLKYPWPVPYNLAVTIPLFPISQQLVELLICQHGSSLTSICMHSATDPTHIMQLRQRCTNIKCMMLNFPDTATDVDVAEYNFEPFGELVSSISFQANDLITDQGIASVVDRCPRLEAFIFTGCTEITDETLDAIASNCLQCKVLMLQETACTAEGVANFLSKFWHSLFRITVDKELENEILVEILRIRPSVVGILRAKLNSNVSI